MLNLITGGQKVLKSMNEGFMDFFHPSFQVTPHHTVCFILFGCVRPEVRIRHTFEISYIPIFHLKIRLSSGLLHRKKFIPSAYLVFACIVRKVADGSTVRRNQLLAFAHRPLECVRCADPWTSCCACISHSLLLVIPSLGKDSFGKVLPPPRNFCKAVLSSPAWPVRNLQLAQDC